LKKSNMSVSEDKSLALYFKEIGGIQPLTSEREAELAAKIKRGDRKAVHALVKANLRFAVSVARNYQNQGLSLSDLINEGNIGLVKAAERFDGTKNFRFISYAVWWIRQTILQALADHSRGMRLPLNRVGAIHKINKAQIDLEQRLNRMPDTAELARELSMTETGVADALAMADSCSSLDAPMADGGSPHISGLADISAVNGPDEIQAKSTHEELERILECLSDREREVVKMSYGVDCDAGYTLEEIGRKLKLTRERVRQIKDKAMRQLRSSQGVDQPVRKRRPKAGSRDRSCNASKGKV